MKHIDVLGLAPLVGKDVLPVPAERRVGPGPVAHHIIPSVSQPDVASRMVGVLEQPLQVEFFFSRVHGFQEGGALPNGPLNRSLLL